MADADSDPDLDELGRRLHDHLAATAELPIDRTANRWLGEAEAIAGDVATSDLDEATTRTRVEQVRHLLAQAGRTGHDEADAHLETARELCERILARTDA
nr:hypothetical protein [Natronobeatus ordinarius]